MGRPAVGQIRSASIAAKLPRSGRPDRVYQKLRPYDTCLGLPAMTQWDLLRKAAAQLLLVYEHFILQAAQGKVLYNDDTRMRVLELMDEKSHGQALREDDPQRRGIFTTGIVSTADGHSLALFFTGPRHAGENLREVLLRRARGLPPPTQMCDALDRNVPKDLEVILANCLSHGRRRFVELADVFPQEVSYILEALKQVYISVPAKRLLSGEQPGSLQVPLSALAGFAPPITHFNDQALFLVFDFDRFNLDHLTQPAL